MPRFNREEAATPLQGFTSKETRDLSPRTFCIFSRELSFSPVRIVSQRRPPSLLRALLLGGDPKADDQSYDHGPSPSNGTTTGCASLSIAPGT